MVLLVGIQGSGKSTLFERQFRSTYVRVNRDELKTRHRERALIEACLKQRQPFVIDNTNPQRALREQYIRQAKEAGFQVTGYYFRTKLADAIARNEQRSGRAKIPVVGIAATHKRLEIPSPEEGYDRLFCVTLDSENRFHIEPATALNLRK
jgi:predicted kinase